MSQRTRKHTSRAADARPAVGGSTERFRLDIDTSKLPPELEATWVREMVKGERDIENVQRALEDRGMRPATYEELNLSVPPRLPGDTTETHGLIRRGGSILMIRERELADEERADLAQVNEEIIATAKDAAPFKEGIQKRGFEAPDRENRVSTKVTTKGVTRFEE